MTCNNYKVYNHITVINYELITHVNPLADMYW